MLETQLDGEVKKDKVVSKDLLTILRASVSLGPELYPSNPSVTLFPRPLRLAIDRAALI